jgi:ribose transport system permease protein
MSQTLKPDDVVEPDPGTASGALPEAAAATPARRDAGVRRRRAPEIAALVVVLIALCAFFSIKSPYFFSGDNFVSIIQAIAVTGIIAVPGTMLIIGGQFDLSVGSAAAVCGVIMVTLAPEHGLFVGVIVSLAAGLAIGVVNGVLVTVVGVNALITTLGMLSVLSGLSEVWAGGQTLPLEGFGALGTAQPIGSVPVPVILYIAIAIIGAALMRYTVFGRSLYAIGSNSSAARLVGVRSRRIILLTFVASGLAAALGGLILTSKLGAASPTAATGMELSVLTAIVLGGASLTGGRGSILGTFVGLAIIGVLNNGLVLLNVNSFYQDVARGALLIVAVSFDQVRQRLIRLQ